MTEFIFLFYLRGVGKRLLGIAGILLSLFYMFKTGSRGCVLALGIAFLFTFALSKQKARMALVAIPVLLIAVIFMPQTSARRILLIFHGTSTTVASGDDASALASQAERTNLLQQSLSLTMHHPLFGVGMGQFVTAVMGEAAKEGKWAANLGTHNSYTQVSSECGIPALIFYCSIIVFCFQRSYRLYQLAGRNPQFKQIEGLAFSLLIGTLVYAVATFFFHIAYSGLLPLISGEVMALYTVAYPVVSRAAYPERREARWASGSRLALQGR
jgi:O-antigen ligase